MIPERTAEDEAQKAAMERAGRLLATRPRTESELRRRLSAAGLETGVVDDAMGRLTQLGLVDDEAFARQWVEERSRKSGKSSRALRSELRSKGVDGDVVEEAVETCRDGDERRAEEAAARWVHRVSGLPVAAQAQKIVAMLVRRGFDAEVARSATRAVLPPEGWE